MHDHFRMLAHYGRWASERLITAADTLSDADFRADHGAFFRSLSGTFNHLVVTDRVWMRRFTGEGPMHTRLDEILTDDRTELATLRRAEDARIIAFVESLDAAALAAPIHYSPLTGPGSFTQPLSPLLAHLFNHQTHHRGQATVILTRIGGRNAAPVLDLVAFQRASGMGME